MLRVTRDDVVADPFPHVVKQGILPDDLFAELAADFPDASIFEHQKSESGTSGSRTGSGFDIYRGDSAFETLTARSPAWARFHAFINSEAFVEQFCSVFADHLDTMGLRIDVRASHVDPSYVEPRATMTEHATFGDKVQTVVNKKSWRRSACHARPSYSPVSTSTNRWAVTTSHRTPTGPTGCAR